MYTCTVYVHNVYRELYMYSIKHFLTKILSMLQCGNVLIIGSDFMHVLPVSMQFYNFTH